MEGVALNPICTLELDSWSPPAAVDGGLTVALELEAGRVLYLPRLTFALREREDRFLDPCWSSGTSKNIALQDADASLEGAAGPPDDIDALRALLARFRVQAARLVTGLLPAYGPELRLDHTSYRPLRVEGRAASWRSDDSRLHVDAFPSRPNRGERILRVFANVNPHGEARVWRVGEPFEGFARRLLPTVSRPLPGSAWLLQTLGITRSKRSEYDHLMLRLHDGMKRDGAYQRRAPQTLMAFAAGSVWICFSDQTPHAAMSGQFMLEQTMHLPVHRLYRPHASPLKTLERLTGRTLT